MKFKILKCEEFNALQDSRLDRFHIREMEADNISIQATEPLYESENHSSAKKIENAVIVLPYNPHYLISMNSLTLNLTHFLNKQQTKGDNGFSVGRYFVGDYKSGDSVWCEKSLCVSLVGAISDRAGTIATANEIMRVYGLPRILIMNEVGAMELTREGCEFASPQQHRIRRIGE